MLLRAPAALFVLAVLLVQSVAPAPAADTAGPAPPLDMRVYRALKKSGNASFDLYVKATTKLAGTIWFPSSEVYVTFDTPYSRWAMMAFCDRWMGRIKTGPTIDKAVWNEYDIVTKTATDRALVHVDHLAAGNYLVFAMLETSVGNPTPALATGTGYDENGAPVTAEFPTEQFSGVKNDALCVAKNIELTDDAAHVETVPAIVDEELF